MSELDSVDHYKFWRTDPRPIEVGVELEGQFNKEPFSAAVEEFAYIGNPVSKNGGRILKEGNHLTAYNLHPTIPRPPKIIHLSNQFHDLVEWTFADPFGKRPPMLLVPACKSLEKVPPEGPTGGDHYLCYPVVGAAFSVRETKPQKVVLLDQFDKIIGKEEVIQELEPAYFGVPVTKKRKNTFHPIENEVAHLAIYRFFETVTFEQQVHTRDQFEPQSFKGCKSELLAVPSIKRFPHGET